MRNTDCCSARAGVTYTVTQDADNSLHIGDEVGNKCECKYEWILVDKSYGNMNLKEKFALVFKGEPEKSFIKAAVMNSDESLTSDGQSLFLSYLLKKNGDDFKTTVIDPILAEEATNK